MIAIGVLGLAIALIAVLVRIPPRGPKPYLSLSLLPLLLTMIAPMPFAMASRGPNDWARRAALATTRIGIATSIILFVVGAVLAARAARAGDSRDAKLLALEATLASMPAGLVTTSWMLRSW